MPPQQNKPAPDFIPASTSPDFIPAGGGQGSSPDYGPDTTVVNPTMGQIGKGVLREGAQLASGAHSIGSSVINAIPGVKNSRFGTAMAAHQATLDEASKPQNIGEAMGKTGAQMASYLAPAKLESSAAEIAPEALRPLARIGTSALSNGTMNKMNGGDFSTGAETGAGFGALSEGARAFLAPALMRSAIPGNIGKDSANALLSETRGVRPTTVLKNTEGRIGQASNDLDASIAAANRRSTPPIRGFLMPPVTETPLAPAGGARGRLSQPITIEGNRAMPREFQGYGVNPPSGPHDLGDVPGEAGPIPPEGADRLPERFNGFAAHEYQGQIPGERGGPGQVQGVLRSRPEMHASTTEGPFANTPTSEPNRIISLSPAKQPVGVALGTAARQRAIGDVDQIQPLMDFLRGEGKYGPVRPDLLTPQEALDARRGYGKEFVSNRQWKQTTNSAPLAAAKQGYGGITGELHAKVPGSIEADDMIHNLAPAKAGLRQLVQKDPSIVGNVAGRVGARTGALTAATVGAEAGARRGLGGALLGGGLGLVAPEVLSSPAAKIGMSRMAYSTLTPKIGRAVATPAIQKLIDALRQQRIGDQAQ